LLSGASAISIDDTNESSFGFEDGVPMSGFSVCHPSETFFSIGCAGAGDNKLFCSGDDCVGITSLTFGS
jgi:hypothetical protein